MENRLTVRSNSFINVMNKRRDYLGKGGAQSSTDPYYNTLTTEPLTSCQIEHNKAKELPPIGRFTPHCKDDGSWHETQCHGSTGYCWCVDKKGKELLGSRIHGRLGRPNCTEDGNILFQVNAPDVYLSFTTLRGTWLSRSIFF